ncbi:hypothetical protein AVEN_27335-1 [Araneus ventricosus]|uniref:Uncharacterized protein n=1 Tax=Araneus ventricosus TaxID=182803 RepID=A0A4Y2GJW9_ARAVE|nr:hypothetical protein AVEN_27335-1 [Araneus ventricosus]
MDNALKSHFGLRGQVMNGHRRSESQQLSPGKSRPLPKKVHSVIGVEVTQPESIIISAREARPRLLIRRLLIRVLMVRPGGADNG